MRVEAFLYTITSEQMQILCRQKTKNPRNRMVSRIFAVIAYLNRCHSLVGIKQKRHEPTRVRVLRAAPVCCALILRLSWATAFKIEKTCGSRIAIPTHRHSLAGGKQKKTRTRESSRLGSGGSPHGPSGETCGLCPLVCFANSY